MTEINIETLNAEVKEKSAFVTNVYEEIGKVIVGQRYMIERMILALLSDGHILVEGVPGLAKTTAVKTLAETIKTGFQRIQFTPDLLPADVIGTRIYQPKDGSFTIKKGPIFSNIILADEINRAPSKVQSALLEAMQERQVTIGDTTFKLDNPFLVMATQNPIEQEGTYPLPEAQTDRFMFKLKVTYPTKEEEKNIMKRMSRLEHVAVQSVITPATIIEARKVIDMIYIDDKVHDYILNIVFATRNPKEYGLDIDHYIEYGASPRASIYLAQAARCFAFLQGRGYVTPQDIKTIGYDILRHRVLISYEAEAEDMTSDDVIKKIFDKIEVP